MKAVVTSLCCLLLLLTGATACAQRPPGRLEHVHISGKEYVRLSDWARRNDFEIRWVKRDEIVQLTKGASRLGLTAESKLAQINGVNVYLSFPIVARNGGMYLAQQDLQNTLQPVLFSPRNSAGAKIRTICLDPGHGGKDAGTRNGSQQEKKYTLLLAQEVRDQLNRAGLKATLTRTTDTLIDLPVRPDLARRRGADLFVSLHFNGANGSRNEIKGIEVYCLTPAGASSTNARGEGGGAGPAPGNRNNDKNMLLAYRLHKSLVRSLPTEDRGVRRARFAVLREAEMPAVLIEGGYLSHPSESKKIYDPTYRRQMARAIVDGLMAYKQQVETGG
ncbi:MAG: N-acetylmuramoyl-L-alanine amidase [Verrucomicrobia bacterium]|nr:N-acetylmuramoyl-L-alanine amidase [Verrucomicrobiota bacterium]